MSEGESTCLYIGSPNELVNLLVKMGSRTCMAWGIMTDGRIKSEVTIKKYEVPGTVSRTRENFCFSPGKSIMMLDIDEHVSFDELVKNLEEVLPDFPKIPYVLAHSASTFIYNGETELRGEGGKRVYIFVAEGTDIPRAGKILGARLKLAGHLNYKISCSGQLLERTLIDECVFQPERLDFCGGAQCFRPLRQRRPPAEGYNDTAEPLDTRAALPDLTTEEEAELDQMRRAQRAVREGDAIKARQKYIEDRSSEYTIYMKNKGQNIDEKNIKENIERAIADSILPDEIILHSENGEEVSVGEVRKNPAKWDGANFADPIDPSYNGDNRIAKALLRGKVPHIFSFAHGGQKYYFNNEVEKIVIESGHYPQIVEQCVDLLVRDGQVYQRGGELVRLNEKDSSVFPINAVWLRNKLEQICTFYNSHGKKIVKTQCPKDIADRILSLNGEWRIKELKSVTSLPFMRLDGTLCFEYGYDESTKVFLTQSCFINDTHKRISKKKLRKIIKRIFAPFCAFPFAGPVDRGVLLAALLTSAIRVCLPTAPGFLASAPVYGTGKTLLAEAIAWTTGKPPRIMAWPDKEAEQRKALVSVLRENPENLILDNLVGVWNSADLAAILTSEVFHDRVLGASQMIGVHTRCLLMGTGNNVSVSGDMARRILVITLDSKEERPDQRTFEFSPTDRVKSGIQGFRCDVLAILRSYILAKKPRVAKGGMGSFEEWEQLVRQTVCWIAEENISDIDFGDPLLSIDNNFESDVNTNRLRVLVDLWYAYFGDKFVTVKEIIDVANANRNMAERFLVDDSDMNQTSSFSDIVFEIAGSGNEVNGRIFSSWIRKNKDRIVDDKRIEQGKMLNGNVTWCVKKVCK